MPMHAGSSPTSIPRPRVSQFALVLVSFLIVAIVTAVLWARFSSAHASVSPSTGADQVTAPEGDPATTIPVAAKGATLQLTEPQQRGKQIYLTGISPTGDTMTAVLGNSSTEVPAAVLTCANCHRHDGRGKAEGGIFPSNIRWEELTKPYGANLPRGQSRPPYDASLLKRGITMGLDPAGTRLDDAMPRYRMTYRDLADLVAYLKVLGHELDPGLSADKIRIGVILAPRNQFFEMHSAVRAASSAFIAEFNRQGGVYQREIELCFSEAPARIEDRAAAAEDFAKREQVFALASSFIAGAEGEISRQLEQEGVPLIGAQTLYPQLDFPLNRQLFYLNSGLHGQSLALVRFARERRPVEMPDAALLFPEDQAGPDDNTGNEKLAGVANTIEAGCASLDWRLQKHAIAPHGFSFNLLAQSLAEQKIATVFSLLSAEQNLQLLQSAAARDWFPTCFLPSDIAGRQLFEAPSGFDRQILLAFSSLPFRHADGMQAYNVLAQQHELPTVQLAAQFEALASLSILVHGLQQAGADLSRERLVEQLETLYEYRSGFAPPVTFGPNRRVGALGAYIVTMDLTNQKLVPVSDWIDGSATSRAGL